MTLNKHSDKITVIAENSTTSPFVIIYKPQGLPSAPLTENDKNCALYQAAQFFPEIMNVKGKKNIEAGLVHRIDNVTDGLLLIATTQQSYDFLLKLQEENRFIKTYNAKCSYLKNLYELKPGFPENLYKNIIPLLKDKEEFKIVLESCFRPYGPGRKEVRPVIENDTKAASKKSSNRIYQTEIAVTKDGTDYNVTCKITNGFRHQVRSHLAWLSIPVKGDPLYNPLSKENEEFFFSATGLEFVNPVNGEKVKVEI